MADTCCTPPYFWPYSDLLCRPVQRSQQSKRAKHVGLRSVKTSQSVGHWCYLPYRNTCCTDLVLLYISAEKPALSSWTNVSYGPTVDYAVYSSLWLMVFTLFFYTELAHLIPSSLEPWTPAGHRLGHRDGNSRFAKSGGNNEGFTAKWTIVAPCWTLFTEVHL